MRCVDCSRTDRTVYLTQEAQFGKVKTTWVVCFQCAREWRKKGSK